MSGHFKEEVPMNASPVTVTTDMVRDAMACLVRHDATDLAEALGMTPYMGATHNGYRSAGRRTVPTWREALA